jgi:hypothetical protein
VSTILDLIEQGTATRAGAALTDAADDLSAALQVYDYLESQRAEAVADLAESRQSSSALAAYDETIADLNERSAEVLGTLVSILRAEA